MTITLINVSHHPAIRLEPEERDFWGLYELDQIDLPLSKGEAFDLINGRTFVATWPEDEIPW
jgi:hypothetical protein